MPDNSFQNVDLISATALSYLDEELIIKPLCSTDLSAEYNSRPNGYKVGDTIRFQVDPVYEAKVFDERLSDGTWPRNDSKAIAPQDIRTSTRSLMIEQHLDVSVTVSDRERAMHFDEFSTKVIRPAARALARKIDTYIGTKILQGYGLYASASVLSTAADLSQAIKASKQQELGDDKYVLMNYDLEAILRGSDWFYKADSRGDGNIIRTGLLTETMGMEYYASGNYPTASHTNSSGATTTKASPTGVENKVGQTSLTVTAIAEDKNFLAGDRIKVAGVKRPMIVKTNAAVAATSIELTDPITELIPANAAVTVVGGDGKVLTHKGAIFDGQALGVAMPMLDPAFGMPSSTISDEVGNSIRVIFGFNQTNKITTLSLDLLVGAFALDPRRITLLADSANA